MEKRLAIVVLNYENFSDTIECVNSLLKQTYKSFDIIIVENGSRNESFNILRKHFLYNNLVTIIRSEENVGFAKGNNLGILFARKQLNSQYIFVINSDTVLTTKDILSQIMISYPADVALVSPKLIDLNGEQQFGLNWYKDKLIKNTLSALLYIFIDLMPTRSRELLIKLKRRVFVSKKNEKREFKNDKNKYQIQGAAFLLTPVFFKYYSIPYPQTFLYFEEVNMAWYLHKANLCTMIINTDEILHKEAKTTSVTFLKNKKIQNKAKLTMRSIIISLPMYFSTYLQVIKRYSENIDVKK